MGYPVDGITPSTATIPPTLLTITSEASIVLPTRFGLRIGALFFNPGAVTVYLGFGFVPTSTVYSVAIAATASWPNQPIPFPFQGQVEAIVASTEGSLLATEFI